VGGALIAGLVALSLWQAPTPQAGVTFAGAVVAAALLLWLTAHGVMRATRRWFPARASYVVRQGVANLFRPQNQTVAVILALGFGVFLIATLYIVQRNLVAQFALDTSPDRPNLALFDIQVDQREAVAHLLDTRGITALSTTPLVPARLARLNGRPVDAPGVDSGAPRPARWALRREYRHTYRDSLVSSERLVAGSWWDDGSAPGAVPRISMEEDVAAELGVGIGDHVTWNIQGVEVESRITSLRRVSWARFQPNFFVVFEPGALERAPQTFALLAREDDAGRRAELQRDVVLAYPNVSTLDLTLVQRTIDGVLTRVSLAVRFMALFSIGSGLAILIGALAASRFQRVREAVLLKTLGAGAQQIRRILLTEYLAWGSFAAFTGVLLAAGAAWALMALLFEVPFHLPLGELVVVWMGVCAVTVLVGFAGSAEVLRGTPLGVLRDMSE
jgi:putative ABC transport system permease protein